MLRFAARQAARLAVGIAGAVFIAGAISASGESHASGLMPLLKAFGLKLFQLVRLDFGHSAVSGLPALAELGLKLPPTLMLLLGSGAVALAVGVPLGLLLALGPARRAAAPLMQIATATPVFCAGLVLAYGAVHLVHWPVSVNAAATADAFPIAILPVLTVGLAGAAAVQLALRRAAAQAGGEPFHTVLRQLGLHPLEIEGLYVLPRVLAGLAASLGEIVLMLVSAAVVAEQVFQRPGVADLFMHSVARADWNMAALIVFVLAAITLVAEFLGRLAGHVIANEGRP